jgi:hypothetical protein
MSQNRVHNIVKLYAWNDEIVEHLILGFVYFTFVLRYLSFASFF